MAARYGASPDVLCVWELRAVCHEQAAWSRYLRSPRRAADMETYVGDTYTGPA